MKSYKKILIGLFLLTLFLYALFLNLFLKISDNKSQNLASVFFQDSITTDELLEKYDNAYYKDKYKKENIKILIVPGHDDKNFGAAFGKIKESDLNLKVGENLKGLIDGEKGLDAFLLRDKDGYNKDFIEYMNENNDEINDFIFDKKNIMNQLVSEGKINTNIKVHHNFAKPEVSQILYSINKFANDNDFDIVLHIHFNDYPGRYGMNGKYNGFSIYIPESQYSNHKASKDFADKIKDKLLLSFAKSNLPSEDVITEDQELIAIGAYNTSDTVSILIEYGYIYESQFTDDEISDDVLYELAKQTSNGILDYFGKKIIDDNTYDNFIRFGFNNNLKRGDRGIEVLAIQDFLRDRGYYPVDSNLNICPMTGFFGNCTENALREFQIDHNIEPTGFFGEKTREIFNALNI